MTKREVPIAENTTDQSENDEIVEIGEVSETGEPGEITGAEDEPIDDTRNAEADDERWFPDLKADWRQSDPRTAPLLSAVRINSSSWRTLTAATTGSPPLTENGQANAADGHFPPGNNHSQPDAPAEARRRWCAPATLAALPFHHLISIEKLASAFAVMPAALIRPQTVGEVAHRRQFFWQSLANSGVTAKAAALLDDSLHCHFVASAAEQTVEVDWEVHYHDELQGCAEMYRAELFAFKRRIYEAEEDLRFIVEMKANEFLPYLNELNELTPPTESRASDEENAVVHSETGGAVETDDWQRWFLDNLTGSFALTVSTKRNAGEQLSTITKPRKTKSSAAGSDYTNYRTYEAQRIESWMGGDGEDDDEVDEVDPTGEVAGNSPFNFSLNGSTAVYRLQLADYWLDWQQAARAARFDFNFLKTLRDVRTMRFYELTKLWRLQSFAGNDADIADENASDLPPVTLEIDYAQFAALMPLPPLRFEREVKEQLKAIIKPLRASGYVKSFAVKTDWRGLDNAYRLVFKFNDDFRADAKNGGKNR